MKIFSPQNHEKHELKYDKLCLPVHNLPNVVLMREELILPQILNADKDMVSMNA